MYDAGHGPHEPLLDLVVGTVVAQGDLEARLVPHSSRLRRAASGAKREDEDKNAVTDGTDAPGIVPVDARSLVAKGGGKQVWASFVSKANEGVQQATTATQRRRCSDGGHLHHLKQRRRWRWQRVTESETSAANTTERARASGCRQQQQQQQQQLQRRRRQRRRQQRRQRRRREQRRQRKLKRKRKRNQRRRHQQQ